MTIKYRHGSFIFSKLDFVTLEPEFFVVQLSSVPNPFWNITWHTIQYVDYHGQPRNPFDNPYPYAPWCWSIYLHLPHNKIASFVGKYTSTMVRIWDFVTIQAPFRISTGAT